MSNQPMRIFSSPFKEQIVRRLESGEALAGVSKELGIARKLLYEWRWAWRRHGAAGLNRRRGPKPGRRRSVATGDPPEARRALKNSSGWSAASSLISIFFAKPCDLPTHFREKSRRLARTTLRAHQRAERGGRVARRKRNGERSQKNSP
jgi:transposase-like protein